MQFQNHSHATDIQLTSKHTSSHGSFLNHLPRKYKSIKADPKAESNVWKQVSSFLAAAILANTRLNTCEVITQLTGDTTTDQNKEQNKKFFATRRWLLSPQTKDNWKEGGRREGSQPVTRKQVL